MSFAYSQEPPADWSAFDAERDIKVRYLRGLGRRPEQGEVGATWLVEHPDWRCEITVEGESQDRTYVLEPAGVLPAVRVEYGPAPRLRLWTFSDPLKSGIAALPPDINEIVADAIMTIYSVGGGYPGEIDYRGPRGVTRRFASGRQ